MPASKIDDIFNELDTEPVSAPELVAFVGDGQTHDVTLSVSRQLGYPAEVRDGECHDAMSYLADNPAPRYLVIDIGNDELSAATSIFSLVAALPEGTRAIAVGAINDIGFYREMIEIGLTDYLLKPLTEKTMLAAFHKAERAEEANRDRENSLQVTGNNNKTVVIGARGGVGASTIAVNLAWLLSDQLNCKTALLDMDIEFGTIALALDVEPTRGLREALEKPERLDSLFISSTTAKLSDNLAVMATEENLTEDISFSPDGIAILMEALAREHSQLIIDLPRTAVKLRKSILSEVGTIILVTDYSLPSLRDCIRTQSAIKTINPSCKLLIVANKTGGPLTAMPPAEFEKALGTKIIANIPDDTKLSIKAANTGKPAVAIDAKSKMTKALAALAKEIAPEMAAKNKKTTWFKRVGRK
ncbi:AAA family ATPase [Kiloniella laminariae]|uniref:AAA family ATPase n=1 Tax=Kiloniella laminariae TaxID=454162 RepID=UPI000362CF72|nr:P-loop NTPase [Kiloniella laminariae]